MILPEMLIAIALIAVIVAVYAANRETLNRWMLDWERRKLPKKYQPDEDGGA